MTARSERVWPQIARALDEPRAENDVVVIEGAGSPAQISLPRPCSCFTVSLLPEEKQRRHRDAEGRRGHRSR